MKKLFGLLWVILIGIFLTGCDSIDDTVAPTPVIPESTRTKIGLVDSEGNIHYYIPTPKPTPRGSK